MEKIAEASKKNGSVPFPGGVGGGNGGKKVDSELAGNGHAHGPDPSLSFTGRFCGGLIDDIKRKAPWFWSDIKDALNFQCLSSVLFMYFACLSPIITFGGLLGTATDQNMVILKLFNLYYINC